MVGAFDPRPRGRRIGFGHDMASTVRERLTGAAAARPGDFAIISRIKLVETLKTEGGRVNNRMIAGDQIGDQAAGAGTDTETMAAEPGGNVKPGDIRRQPNDRHGVRGTSIRPAQRSTISTSFNSGKAARIFAKASSGSGCRAGDENAGFSNRLGP